MGFTSMGLWHHTQYFLGITSVFGIVHTILGNLKMQNFNFLFFH
uniref:Uncharacterized protein n=1 Tax=Rhizophora mucronata TaxID=61149 RepID=A0A2P2QXY8_RHIMU